MSFRENFLENLPDDPAEALFLLSDRAEDWMRGQDQVSDYGNQDRYICRLLLDLLEESYPDSVADVESCTAEGEGQGQLECCIRVITSIAATHDAAKLTAQFGSKNTLGIAELTQEEKQKAHEHLNFIREVIEKSTLDDKKKNALLKTLNKLATEIDKIGTKTDQFFAFFSELGFYFGEFGRDSKPLWDSANETLKILTKSRAKKENISLPKNDKILQLPEPDTDLSEEE